MNRESIKGHTGISFTEQMILHVYLCVHSRVNVARFKSATSSAHRDITVLEE